MADQLERLADATPEALAAATDQARALAELAAALQAARPAIEALDERVKNARQQVEGRREQLTRLRALRPPDDVGRLATALAEAAGESARRTDAEEEAATALDDAEARLDVLPERSQVEETKRHLVRRAELQDGIDAGERALLDVTSAVEKLQQQEHDAEQRRDACAAAVDRLRIEHRAHALVPVLRAGEPCPVCRQTVATIPDVRLPDLADAEAALARAKRDDDEAGRSLATADRQKAQMEAGLANQRAELDKVAARLDGQPSLDTVDRQLTDIVAAETAVEAARRTQRDARAAQNAATRRHKDLTERERQARRSFDAARDTVAALGPPAPECIDLAADWRALLAWADERQPQLATEIEEHLAAAARAEEDADDRRAALVEACRTAGVQPPPPPTWPGEAVAAQQALTTEKVQRIEHAIAEANRLRDDIAAATERRQVADTLARHLDAKHFEKWLLDEAVHRLASGATQILGELSNHAYSLSVDPRTNAFTVVDHTNASQTRPARTLSGGETFLASLSLALALADQVAELAVGGAARLESLFLDEGFGALDADTLDVVATALDELGARGRMVGVVTHIRELAERLPVQFEVRKAGGIASVTRTAG
jgi:exonuclease SbcC